MNTIYATLHQKIQNDDQKAFAELFNLLWRKLYTLTRAILMNEDVAKDIVQEVWIDYWKRRKEIKNTCIEAYLTKAVRYKAYNYLRDTPLNAVQIETIQSIPISAEIELTQNYENTQNKVRSVLKNLPKRCREIFILSRNEKMSNEQIATHYQISKRTVENQITFALKKLREALLCIFF